MIRLFTLLLLIPVFLKAQTHGVKNATKWVDGKNGFEAVDGSNRLGRSHCNLGDVDGDGNNDIGLITNGSTGTPYIHVAFLNADGAIREQSIIEPGKGDFKGDVNSFLIYVEVICAMGDLNKDGVPDLAVSFTRSSEVYVIFLQRDGSVKTFTRLMDGKNGLNLDLDKDSNFGTSLYGEADFNGDGINDLVVGDSEFSYAHGSVYVLYLNKEAKVEEQLRIRKDASWGYNETDFIDRFGNSITSIDDINGDGIDELIVGGRGDSHLDAGPTPKNGSLYCLFLKKNKVDSVIRLRSYDFAYNDSLSNYSAFARSVANAGDLDGNSYDDLIVGITNDSACGQPVGSAVVLYMKEGFEVDTSLTLACWTSNMEFEPISSSSYSYGYSVAGLGDINGDGMFDVSVGSIGDSEVRSGAGALFLIHLTGKKYVSTSTIPHPSATTIYPNPSNGVFKIETDGPATLHVLSTCGKVLWQGTTTGSYSLDASQWPAGMYLIRAQQKNGKNDIKRLIVN